MLYKYLMINDFKDLTPYGPALFGLLGASELPKMAIQYNQTSVSYTNIQSKLAFLDTEV